MVQWLLGQGMQVAPLLVKELLHLGLHWTWRWTSQWQYRELVLTHIAGHNSVHLAATISQRNNLMPLHFETHESLWTKPVHGWSVSKEGGGAACGGYTRHYFCGGFVWAGAFFCGLVPLEFKCSLCQAQKVLL